MLVSFLLDIDYDAVMLVSHRREFIYTKTFKTASTSVEVYFEPFCLPAGELPQVGNRDEYVTETGIVGYRGKNPQGTKKWFNHMPAALIKEQIGEEIWDSYFKFCAIRNPFEKLVSGFAAFDRNTEKRGLNNLKTGLKFVPYDGFVLMESSISGDSPIERFRNWIRNGGEIIDRDKYLIDEKICMDYFIRYEDLENGIKQVCEEVNVEFLPGLIRSLKSGIRDCSVPIKDYYDQETRKIVEKKYRFELEFFGYDFSDFTSPE